MTTAHPVDPAEAVAAFSRYVEAIASGDLARANGPRRRLEDCGLLVVWQPGRSRAARALAEGRGVVG